MEPKKQLRPWQGVLFFVLIMAVLLLIMAPIQWKLGIYGLAITELGILLLSIGFARVCKADLRAVFPIYKPKLSKTFGTLLLWIGGVTMSLACSGLILYFFPEEMTAVGDGLSDVIVSVPVIVSVFITCLMPAVCEEAVHRGVILNSLLPLKNKWLIVFLMGIFFGLFHTSIWRFVPTAILGAFLSYVMLETRNIIYPAVFHGINNLFPTLLSFLTMKMLSGGTNHAAMESLSVSGVPLASVSVYIIIASVVPFGMYCGSYLLHKGNEGYRNTFLPQRYRALVLTLLIVSTVLIFLIGVVLFVYGIFYDPVFQEYMNEFSQPSQPKFGGTVLFGLMHAVR